MIFVVIWIVFGIVFAVIGSNMARARGRDPAIWAVICFVSCLIGVIILAMSGPASSPTLAQPSQNLESLKKWEVLVELDPEIRAAAATARALGPRYEQILAQKYLALSDKTYLAAALEAVSKQADADSQQAEADRQSSKIEMWPDYSSGSPSGTQQNKQTPTVGDGVFLDDPAKAIFLVSAFVAIVGLLINLPFNQREIGLGFLLVQLVLTCVPLAFSGYLGFKQTSSKELLKRIVIGSAGYQVSASVVILVYHLMNGGRSQYMGGPGMTETILGLILTSIIGVALNCGAAFAGIWFSKRAS